MLKKSLVIVVCEILCGWTSQAQSLMSSVSVQGEIGTKFRATIALSTVPTMA